jgi:hypothetical protein
MKKEKQTYILDNDQPTTCPKCGTRTYFTEHLFEGKIIQTHSCSYKLCKYSFIGEFENNN